MSEYELILKRLRNDILSLDGVEDILITGSLSRNEETYFNGRYLISDIDVVILTRFTTIKSTQSVINNIVKDVLSKLKFQTPFFEISIKYDYYFTYKLKLIINKNIGNFELFKNAISLKSNNKAFSGNYKISGNDLYQVNLLLLVRLYKQIEENLSPQINKVSAYYGYSLNRNTLDATTVLLPNLGIYKTSYSIRNNELKNIDLDRDFKKFHTSSYLIKRSPPENPDILNSYYQFIYSYLYAYNKIREKASVFKKNKFIDFVYGFRTLIKIPLLLVGNSFHLVGRPIYKYFNLYNEDSLFDILISIHFHRYKELGGTGSFDYNFKDLDYLIESASLLTFTNMNKIFSLNDVEILLSVYMKCWRSRSLDSSNLLKKYR